MNSAAYVISMIKRGERVEIRVQRGALMLTAAGEARQDGFEGDSIRVKNIESHREILCQARGHVFVFHLGFGQSQHFFIVMERSAG